jgi:hypothetical protein
VTGFIRDNWVILLAMVIFLVAAIGNLARAAPIKKLLPADSTTDLARVQQPALEVDPDGDPMVLPVVSLELVDRWSLEQLVCVPSQNGTLQTFEYPLPVGLRHKVLGRNWTEPGCTGISSPPSENWYLIFIDGKPGKPWLE